MTISNGYAGQIASRVRALDVSLIVKISEMAAARKRAGEDIISLGTGEPDFDTPDFVKHAAQAAIDSGETKYTANTGTPALKAAIVARYRRQGIAVEPNQIIASTGAKQVLFNAMMATLEPGDEVIVPTPYWTSYVDIIAICGGVPVEVRTRGEDGFVMNPEAMEAAVTSRTRWLLLNSPSNPSGGAYNREQLRALLPVFERHPHLGLTSDEIYEHLVYDDFSFISVLKALPELAERTLVVNGVSKSHAMTGWRLGFGVGPVSLIAAMSTVQGQATSAPSSISQAAAVAALDGPTEILESRRQNFWRRRDIVVAGLNAISGLDCPTPRGAFYVFPDCTALLGRRTPEGTVLETDTDLCDYYLSEAGVAVVPGTAFGAPGHFRISYAYAQTALEAALDRIAAATAALT
ncbi:pyridoxal phosphate-dependent aminotransferase [Pelagibacterium luteolum]|uniref:Aminotransferase n=1 Tax=Pelagibacterium luteolum TaxID=440168 RepID=A0A1G7Z8F7_9HYPH|nr:pyridoxal phosphate-dependent aminotransferase [Pelagibacterium luteolum]SDH04964.1 aspartate aminotransferase [Pelagibacterium luteolum]